MLSRHDETDETTSVDDGEEAAAARVEAGGPGLCWVQSRVGSRNFRNFLETLSEILLARITL